MHEEKRSVGQWTIYGRILMETAEDKREGKDEHILPEEEKVLPGWWQNFMFNQQG